MAKTVLVVDDDPDFQEMLEAILSPEGWAVVACPVPTQAKRMALQLQPNVIIVDLVMPGYTGWQVVEQFKTDPQTASIPIIVCTAALSHLAQVRARLQQWACEIITKPFELDDLLRIVAKLTARKSAS